MGGRCTTNKIQYSFFLISIHVLAHGCSSLNLDGVALLDFQARVTHDPNGAFTSWNSNDKNPCSWSHVHCVFGHVQVLNLKGMSLEGELAPELGNLTHLRRLILSQNHFSGVIPKELDQLKMLEVLDLRDNNFIGNIPPEIERIESLKILLLYDNNFEGTIPTKLENLNLLYKLQFDHDLTFHAKNPIVFLYRRLGHCIWQDGLNPVKDADSLLYPFKETLVNYLKAFQMFNMVILDNSYVNEAIVHNLHIDGSFISRKLVEDPANIMSKYFPSGKFPKVRTEIKKLDEGQPPSSNTSDSNSNGKSTENETNSDMLLIMIGVSVGGFLLFNIIALFFTIRNLVVRTVGDPWKCGMGRHQPKSFVTGVQKLNRTELETACEDFSNIIETMECCTLFKGTLSNGVEICVASTTITRLKDWSKRAELGFHKKIETLSRINHKNFVNLIGYCEEDEPFVRMLVFEYAPNGSLSKHLQVQELEYLDWRSRMRIIMGVAYCLRFMHDLNPPVLPMHLNSNMIYLTDDYAAKVADIHFWKDFYPKRKISGTNESIHPVSPSIADKETNIYGFGVLLLEIISRKHSYPDKLESLVAWAEQFLKEKKNMSLMIDPTLKSFKRNELEIVCEVIQECIQKDAYKRPNINEIISKLSEVLRISPDQATPKLSPLWWAELELLSG